MIIMLSALLSLLNTLFLGLIDYTVMNNNIKFILFPISLSLVEIIKEFLLGGFPWNPSAIIFIENYILIQATSFIGIYGLGILMHLVVGFVLHAIYFKNKKILLVLIVFILLLFLLRLIPNKVDNSIDSLQQKLSIILIQPNIKETLHTSNLLKNIDIYEKLTSEAINKFPKTDLIIWPEGSVPIDINNRMGLLNRIGSLISSNQKIILGSSAIENNKLYNRLYVINSSGKIDQFYDKQKLVLFGEYLPLINNEISKFLNLGMSFSKGSLSKKIILPNNFTASPMICFESIFDGSLIHENICDTDFIIQISNDSWFGNYYGPIQHFKNSVLRSIEKNKILIRSTPSGITAVVDQNGNIRKTIPSNEKQYLQYNLYKSNNRMCLNSLQYSFVAIILIFLFGLLYDRVRK